MPLITNRKISGSVWHTPFDQPNALLTKLATTGEVVNAALDGLPTETPIALTGNPEAGKTIFSMEMAYKIVSEIGREKQGNIAVVNTEKPNSQIYALWESVFSRKYNVPNVNLFVEERIGVEELMAFNGYKITITPTKGKVNPSTGKVSKPKNIPVLLEVDIKGSRLKELIEKEDVRVIIYDSLTAPFNIIAAGGQQNLPERHNVEEQFFQSIRLAFHNTDAIPITINHVSYNPAGMFLTRESYKTKGGKSIEHNHDYIFYLEKQMGKVLRSQRTLWVQRHPYLLDWQSIATLWLDDNGFRVMTKEETDKIKAEARAKFADKKGKKGKEEGADGDEEEGEE